MNIDDALFELPVFDVPQVERLYSHFSWEDVMRETELTRQYHRSHFDSPEKRLRDKNPAPFRMD